MNNHKHKIKRFFERIALLLLIGALSVQLTACGTLPVESIAENILGEHSETEETSDSTIDAASSAPTVQSQAAQSASAQKPEIDGFDEATNVQVQIGNIIFSVPDYFSEVETENEEIVKAFRHSEENEAVATLVFLYLQDSDVKFPQEDFNGSEQTNRELVEVFGFENVVISGASVVQIAGQSGYEFTYYAENDEGVSVKGYSVYQTDGTSLLITALTEVGETEYSYSGDFDKIVTGAASASVSSAVSASASDSHDESEMAGDPDAGDADGISSEFKATMDSYESFFDDYIEFMAKYNANPSDLTLQTEYLDWLNQYTDFMGKLLAIKDEELTDAELAYYLQVTARIEQKLLGTYSGDEAEESNSAAVQDNGNTAEAADEEVTADTTVSGSVEIGTEITMGSYEQDNNTADGEEDIEWIVIAVEGNRALVISRYALDCQPYCSNYKNITWETCTLRTWLNDTFYDEAFDEEEKAQIQSAEVTADPNPEYDTDPGADTTDRVFLLSISELKEYCTSDVASCKISPYAKANGGFSNSSEKCWWWLRTPGDINGDAVSVNTDGTVDYDGDDINHSDICVRPAMWIEISD